MAKPRKVGDKWRVEFRRKDFYASERFKSKSAASEWLVKTEARYLLAKESGTADMTVAELLDVYAKKVSVKKRSAKNEAVRITFMKKQPWAVKKLSDVSRADFSHWRDDRLRSVSAGTVLRDWSLLTHLFTVAVDEWEFMLKSPLVGVSKPKSPPARDRRVSADELAKLKLSSGYEFGDMSKTARTYLAFLFAIETGMRMGEICKLHKSHVTGRVAHLAMTKNGTARDVPLSKRALSILDELPDDDLFDMNAGVMSTLFRKVIARTGIDNLHFHDSRHEAITQLANKMPVLKLARMVGIRDLKILMVYYNETAEEIADLLD